MRQVMNSIDVEVVHFSDEPDPFRTDPADTCEATIGDDQKKDYLSIGFLCRDTDGNEITFPFEHPSNTITTDDYPSGIDKNVIIEAAVSKFRKFVTECVNNAHLHDGTSSICGSYDTTTEEYL